MFKEKSFELVSPSRSPPQLSPRQPSFPDNFLDGFASTAQIPGVGRLLGSVVAGKGEDVPSDIFKKVLRCSLTLPFKRCLVQVQLLKHFSTHVSPSTYYALIEDGHTTTFISKVGDNLQADHALSYYAMKGIQWYTVAEGGYTSPLAMGGGGVGPGGGNSPSSCTSRSSTPSRRSSRRGGGDGGGGVGGCRPREGGGFQASLRFNPHIPSDEVDLLPSGLITTIDGHLFGTPPNLDPMMGITSDSEVEPTSPASCYPRVSLLAECCTIRKVFWHPRRRNLERYRTQLPGCFQNVEILVIEKPTENQLKKVIEVFSQETPESRLHTLEIIGTVSETFLLGLLEAKPPSMARLMLDWQPQSEGSSSSGGEEEVSGKSNSHLQYSTSLLSRMLPFLAENPYIEELPMPSDCAFPIDPTGLSIVQRCGHVSFLPVKDMWQMPMRIRSFLSPAISETKKVDGHNAILLRLYPGGPAVAYPWSFVHRSLHLSELLLGSAPTRGERRSRHRGWNGEGDGWGVEHDATQGGTGAKHLSDLVVDISPPVSLQALEAAVCFTRFYTPEEVHLKCAEMEDVPHDSLEFCPVSWWHQWDQFWELKKEVLTTQSRRVCFLCELMAVACHLNIPTLKRFTRVALVAECTVAYNGK